MLSNSEFKVFATNYITTNPKLNLYIVADHTGMPGLHRELVASPAKWASLFADSREENELSVAPFLILLGSYSSLKVSSRLLRWITDNGVPTSSLILLASSQSLDTVQERLSKRLDMKISQNMDAMLRFFDPRVLEQLKKILSLDQAKNFFSAASTWWFVDRLGKLVEVSSEFKEVDDPCGQLCLSEKQEATLVEALEPDRVIHLLLEAVPHLKKNLPHDRYGFAADKIRLANTFGIMSTIDLSLYCIVSLLCGDSFEKERYWSEGLDQVQSGEAKFTQIVENYLGVEI
ncbi:DUF4123 domain-containing protein [Massilia sp. Leaf139]|uniref:DUF4123 domain-containing protein n=1 Tax=Massilia sp. Leaf139 TaxID=1736272 RepID=UPI00138F6EC7|nr:DUF4123 domain-containing protein [Massilia sp. Leaf139]